MIKYKIIILNKLPRKFKLRARMWDINTLFYSTYISLSRQLMFVFWIAFFENRNIINIKIGINSHRGGTITWIGKTFEVIRTYKEEGWLRKYDTHVRDRGQNRQRKNT